MAHRPLPQKPGAERKPFRPDRIVELKPTEPTQLLDFLFASLPDQKRTSVKELLRHRQVAVNDRPVTLHATPIGPDDNVKVNFSREFQVFYHPRVKLVYEDDDVIVINKGYGVLSMSTDSKAKQETAYSIVRDYLKRKNPASKLFIVHRLDRDTSGLMMFVKNEESKAEFRRNWYNMVIERKYVCVIEGCLEQPEGIIESYLTENSQYEVYSTEDTEVGRRAITRYRTLKSGHGMSLVEVELDTGRKNQIRVHMSEQGHPIVGDRKYGAKSSPIHRLALHAMTLRFVHPITRRDMNFTTPIPAGFRSIV